MNETLPSLPPMQDLRELLRFEANEGRIWLGEERMILLGSSEMRALRRELIETLGIERARSALMRMGFSAGQTDADTAKRLRPDGSLHDIFAVGPQAHMITGQVKVTPVVLELDEYSRSFRGVFEWHNSFEAEIFLAEFGTSIDPVCWVQTGYAAGYTTRFTGRQALFRELSCAGCGDDKCLLEGRFAEDWPDAEELQRFYEPSRIADQLMSLQTQVVSLRDTVSEVPGFGDMVGCSEGFLNARDLLAKAADTNVSILLLGETGVGKDMFAKAVHKASSRSDKPFVAINCSAIPKDLIEAELFGVEKGAYTGAETSRSGRFERADGGTLFLDEVGELSLHAQATLLRVLQEGDVERLGGQESRRVDVRIIAATNKDLMSAVRDGKFRSDLFYRLNTYTVTVPPLRNRHEDIPDLVDHFVRRYAATHGKGVMKVSDRALAMIRSYDWPGNVRELANVVERGVILAGSEQTISFAHLFPHIAQASKAESASGASQAGTRGSAVEIADAVLNENVGLQSFEDTLIARALERSGGNVSRAARLLGISRATLDYRLKRRGANG